MLDCSGFEQLVRASGAAFRTIFWPARLLSSRPIR